MRNSLIIFLSIIFLSGCDPVEDKPDCSAVMCEFVARSIKIKYVDKTTNMPLFSQGSTYTLADLQISRMPNSNYTPEVKFDLNDQGVIIITPVFGGEVLTLRSFTPDNISMQTKVRGIECCAPIDVISLKINGETVCAPCSNLNTTVAVIKK